MQTSDDGEIQQTDPVSVSGTFDDDNEDAIQTIDLSQLPQQTLQLGTHLLQE